MSLVVQFVVGQFKFVEADHLTYPRLSRGGRVRVYVDTRWHGGVSVPCYHPLGAVVHVPAGWKKNNNNRPQTTNRKHPLTAEKEKSFQDIYVLYFMFGRRMSLTCSRSRTELTPSILHNSHKGCRLRTPGGAAGVERFIMEAVRYFNNLQTLGHVATTPALRTHVLFLHCAWNFYKEQHKIFHMRSHTPPHSFNYAEP